MDLIEVKFGSLTYRLDNVGGADYVARQMSSGSYEAPLPMLMMATLVRTEGSFVDVGANTGVYTILAALVAPNRKIVAFEPLPFVADILKRNLEANGLSRRVDVRRVALSNRTGSAVLHIPDQQHGLVETSASLEQDFQRTTGTVEVPVELFDELEIADAIGVIKVDIEGHEHAFLDGARRTIMRDRPMIFAEVLLPAKRRAIAAFIRDADYMDFRLRPDLAIHDGDVIFDSAAWNHCLVPRERLQIFKEACDSCGVVMVRRFTLS